jgi:uncharacterized membrane protein
MRLEDEWFMQHQRLFSRGDMLASAIHSTLRALPIACFALALLADIAYAQTSNLLWLHFSEWLLLAGTVGAALALLACGIDYLVRRVRPSWPAIIMGIVAFGLAVLNNLVHTADGWTAVVPSGLALSATTVVAMIATAWFGRRGNLHA